MWKILDSGVFSPFTDLRLKCLFSCAYFDFLRCGEITCRSASSIHFVQIRDISFGDNCYVLRLRKSKTDPFSKGVNITIYENHIFKPVHTMLLYLQSRKALSSLPLSPLFIDEEFNQVPILRERFIQYLRSLLLRAGFNDSNYSGHSFRIGAATAAAAAGVEDHVIKELGRWSSDCYVRYIRTDSEIVKKAQEKLSLGSLNV